ncbi:MAG: DUF1501 domain-containing protein [Planctomycetia bacterium]|nr:DUF1501 domain-containing protein [Planctomycetia bacterium]
MIHDFDPSTPLSRRQMLARSGLGFGSLALSALLHDDRVRADDKHASAATHGTKQHFAPRAKAVIQLMQTGGPSQMDLFDPKPELQKRGGQASPFEVEKFLGGNTDTLFAGPFGFVRRGRSGMPLSTLMPETGALADEMCLVRSMYTEHNNHTEATVMINTGKTNMGRPALGAWCSYALGTENENLPSFVVLRDPKKYDTAGSLSWSSGWLPAVHQGTEFSSQGVPVPNLYSSRSISPGAYREKLDLLARLNGRHRERFPRETELEARIENYELAARMQGAAVDVLDTARETEATRKMYGLDDPTTAAYGTRCLMARRLVESGVRFVQVFCDQEGQAWDTHSKLPAELPKMCKQTDRPTAALIRDLKQRGLLDETIVLWTGEFGRLPVSQNADGRDHNRNAFSLFMVGGGFRGGTIYGATDDFGYRAVTDRVSVPDLHATILHQLGLDHHRVSIRHHGRDETLTDPAVTGAHVVEALIA